jgi:sec-independent protein translocase protein TatA
MGLSGWHILLLVIIILVFFGPSRLPSLGKSMGEAIKGFKKGLDGEEIDVTQQSRERLSAPQDEHVVQTQKNKTHNDV